MIVRLIPPMAKGERKSRRFFAPPCRVLMRESAGKVGAAERVGPAPLADRGPLG